VSVELLFKKYFHALALGLIALAAYFQASGVSYLVGAQIAPGSGPAFRPMIQAKVESPGKLSAQRLQRRNPFDSETGSVFPADKPVEETPEEQTLRFDDPLTVPFCQGVTIFIITESTDPLWSFAAIQGDGDKGPKLRRVGDSVGSRKVAYIGFNPETQSPTVWLESDTLCQASMFGLEEVTPPAPAAAEPKAEAEDDEKPADKSSRAVPDDIKSKIKKISETEYEVDRSAVDKILSDQAQLMRSARIVPEQKDGKTIGIRLFGVRPDTLLGTLGLKNGDRLETINDFNMGSPEKALEAYARLRTAETLKLNVNRRGQPTTIQIKIK
jgi:general secretion pathway protein C